MGTEWETIIIERKHYRRRRKEEKKRRKKISRGERRTRQRPIVGKTESGVERKVDGEGRVQERKKKKKKERTHQVSRLPLSYSTTSL